MAIGSEPLDQVRFANFEFDCRTGDLRRGGVSLKLQPQPARVLAVLIRRAGEIVTRQELVNDVWGTDTFVDFEHGLNYAIRQIRTALEDDADRPRFLETLPKRGYRFIAPLVEVTPVEVSNLSVAAAASLPNRSSGTRFGRKSWGIVFVLFLAAAAFGWGRLRRSWTGNSGVQQIRSLAVLPLRNLSNDSQQEYFSDGMTDELITDLARIGGLRVISHTSVDRYKGAKLSLPNIARELGVDAVVEGTVLRSNDRVRITAQLIDARSDQHLWAQSYERDLKDVLGLQHDVARDIAGEIAVKLTPPQAERMWSVRAMTPQAHEAYLKGVYNASKLTPEGLDLGIQYFDQAIKLDPDYAPAYAGKAEAYGWAAGFSIMPPGEVLPKAKAAALKALELDETLSQAHHSLAWANYALDWDFRTAEAHFQRAIELNPNDVTAHLWYGMFLAERGRTRESLEEMNRAHELSPFSLMVKALGATPLLVDRRYDEVISHGEEVLTADPANPVGHWLLLTAYERKGDLARAIDEMEKTAVLYGQTPDNAAKQVAPLRSAYDKGGSQAYWQVRMSSLQADYKNKHADGYDLAAVSARAGRIDQALALLNQSYALRSTQLLYWIIGDPSFDTLRTNPKFQDLLHHIATRPT